MARHEYEDYIRRYWRSMMSHYDLAQLRRANAKACLCTAYYATPDARGVQNECRGRMALSSAGMKP
jgi:hypothetical protein